jgi:hypothetical protein
VPGCDPTSFILLCACVDVLATCSARRGERKNSNVHFERTHRYPFFVQPSHDRCAYEIANMDSAGRARGRGRASLFPLRSFIARAASASFFPRSVLITSWSRRYDSSTGRIRQCQLIILSTQFSVIRFAHSSRGSRFEPVPRLVLTSSAVSASEVSVSCPYDRV